MRVPEPISMQNRLKTDYRWTRRQSEVLGLLADGRSNTEIARALGVTLAGAKWHVAEILSKLQADSREEAAEYWRRYQGLRPRFERIFRGIVTVPAAKWAIAAVGALGMLTAAVAVLIRVNGEPSGGVSSRTSDRTQTATVEPTGVARPSGMFEEPRPNVPSRRVTVTPLPTSPFSPWDGKSSVIYDVRARTERDLGAGSLPIFSPDGHWAVWIAGQAVGGRVDGEARAIDLSTGVVKGLGMGSAGSLRFVDDHTVVINSSGTGSGLAAVDLVSGDRRGISADEANRLFRERLQLEQQTTPGGYQIRFTPNALATPVARGGPFWGNVTVTDLRSGETVLAFEAFAAAPAGAGYIVVASKPSGATVNIFLVSVANSQAQFIGTTRLSEPNFPLAADDRWIAWVDDFCGEPPGNLFVYERSSGQLVEVAGLSGFLTLTPSGELALGNFGATTVVDPQTLSIVSTVPGGGDVSWSRDYRYAAHGQVGGHGGLC